MKPCPFCGNNRLKTLVSVTNLGSGFCTICPECHAQGPRKDTEEEGILAWEMRNLVASDDF